MLDGIPLHRQRCVFNKKVLDERLTVSDQGLLDGSVISVKDLGPQVPWKTVFLIEYAGPILIHSLLFFFPNWFYTVPLVTHSPLQWLALILTILHYLKREYETLFVHRFSLGYMPWTNLPKNCFHYWVLALPCWGFAVR